MDPLTTKKIGVLMGGRSTEREISLKSGRAMEASLRRQGCQVAAIDVTENAAHEIRQEKIELAVIALHGRFGEDGAIQGLLEIMGIPYTGSGVLASAIGMNKSMTKRLLQYHGIPTPRFALVRRTDRPDSLQSELPAGFDLPVVVKPTTQGSTVGVTIVRDSGQIPAAYADAFRYDAEILIEEYIQGHEITAGIVEEEALPLIEIVPKEEFYNFEAKYTKGMTEYIIPARLSKEITREVQRLALKTHQALGCEGYSRVDFRVDPQGRPYVLEINTLPGMTETSLLPKAALAAGMDYDALVARLVKTALKKRGAPS
jgi:D-alanine-D-alanine ligase